MTEEGERRTSNSEGRKSRNTPRRGVKLEVQQGRPRPMIAVHEAEAQFSALEAPSSQQIERAFRWRTKSFSHMRVDHRGLHFRVP